MLNLLKGVSGEISTVPKGSLKTALVEAAFEQHMLFFLISRIKSSSRPPTDLLQRFLIEETLEIGSLVWIADDVQNLRSNMRVHRYIILNE